MRFRWHILFVIVLLVVMVTGCGGRHHYDGRLVTADSLMHDDPDSALALVEAVLRAELTRDGDRAYHDLLLTQARYRCYITATSDSDINRALDYYQRHNIDREKLTRTYIYKGAVMEELGHPDSAMFYYKHAEATAASDDYFNLGYSKLRIAELYQRLYTNDSAALSRIIQATQCFSIINDTSYLITTIGAHGLYIFDTNKDSARLYLEKAIALARAIESQSRYFYQSKLSGIYFYQGDYLKAKNLAMDIIKNGKNACDENAFYYYAARSFIKLSQLDSANDVLSILPVPITAVDSMNHYRLLAELSEAEHRYLDYGNYISKSKAISDRFLMNAIKENVSKEEIKIEANFQKNQIIDNLYFKFSITIGVLVILMVLTMLFIRSRIKSKITAYQNEIECTRQEMEFAIASYENKISQQEQEYEEMINQKNNELNDINKINEELKSNQLSLHQQVTSIVRMRKSALSELYQEIRVKTSSSKNTKKRPLPLLSLIKDLNDKKELLHISPKESFWDKLKTSINSEYNGIATFVENNYPKLEKKDYQLFLLLCADISPQIIKLCLGYDHAVTVSNYKRRLVKDIFRLDIRFDDFIQLYLNGYFDEKKEVKKSD